MSAIIKTTGVLPADCPEDGGKWAIYCEHRDESGEIIGTGVVQDTNKRRLATWQKHSLDWCCYCQEEFVALIASGRNI